MTTPASFDLTSHGLSVTEVYHNFPPSALYEHAIRYEKDASIADNGALVAYSGAKTGRSPKDKRVVENPASKNDIWWGPVNIPCDEHTFQSTASGRSTTLILGIVSTASMALPDGIRIIASRSA